MLPDGTGLLRWVSPDRENSLWFALQDIGKNIYTLKDVVDEIRDKPTRRSLAFLPYQLNFKEPHPEHIRHGSCSPNPPSTARTFCSSSLHPDLPRFQGIWLETCRNFIETSPWSHECGSRLHLFCFSVMEFSKRTGDYPSLSATDIKVLALTYQLELEHVGSGHLKTEPAVKVENKPSLHH